MTSICSFYYKQDINYFVYDKLDLGTPLEKAGCEALVMPYNMRPDKIETNGTTWINKEKFIKQDFYQMKMKHKGIIEVGFGSMHKK